MLLGDFQAQKRPKNTQKALFGALRGRCPKLPKKHSVGHFQAQAPEHACKWRAGSQVYTLRSEIITQLYIIPQKLFRAMITRTSRNPARNNSSEVFWHNNKMVIAQINSWKHATKTGRNQRATTKMRNRPESNSPRVISHNRL